MVEFCNGYIILSPFQFGFRAQISTDPTLEYFTNDILRALAITNWFLV